jgi:Fur family zinc uptake transcriptional regulator
MASCTGNERALSTAQLLAQAVAICEQRGQRFTPMRRQVFEIVAGARSPLTAYNILDKLLASGTESAPPTVYRALDFLLQQNLVHRVESLNAFLPCAQPQVHHDCQFLICTACGTTEEVEVNGLMTRLTRGAKGLGFSINEAIVELRGLCARCSSALISLARVSSDKKKPA